MFRVQLVAIICVAIGVIGCESYPQIDHKQVAIGVREMVLLYLTQREKSLDANSVNDDADLSDVEFERRISDFTQWVEATRHTPVAASETREIDAQVKCKLNSFIERIRTIRREELARRAMTQPLPSTRPTSHTSSLVPVLQGRESV